MGGAGFSETSSNHTDYTTTPRERGASAMLKLLLPPRSFLLLQLLLLGEGWSSKVLMPSGNEDTKTGRKSRTRGGC